MATKKISRAVDRSNKESVPVDATRSRHRGGGAVPVEERQAKVEAVRERVAAVQARKRGQTEKTVEDVPAATPAAEPEQIEVIAEPELAAPAGDSAATDSEEPAAAPEIAVASAVQPTVVVDDSLRNELTELKLSNERLEALLSSVPDRLVILENTVQHNEQSREQTQEKLAELEGATRDIRQAFQELQAQLAELLASQAKQAEVAAELPPPAVPEVPDNSEMIAANEALKAQVLELEEKLAQQLSRNEELNLNLSQINDDLSQQQALVEKLSNESKQREESLELFVHQLHSREEELEELSVLNEELDGQLGRQATEFSAQKQLLEEELANAKSEETLLQLRILELETSLHNALEAANSDQIQDLNLRYKELQEDHKELQQLHRELRDEYLSETTKLNEERGQLSRDLEQARDQLMIISGQYCDQVDSVEKLTMQLTLCDLTIEETEKVLDSLPPPPPSLVQPIKRLRGRIQELRAQQNDMKRPDFKTSKAQIASLQEELLATRQRVLEAHTEIDRLETRLRNSH